MAGKRKQHRMQGGLPGRLTGKMKLRGLSQFGLARKLGVSHTTVGDWCSGKSEPSTANMVKLANELKVPVDWLADNPVVAVPADEQAGFAAVERWLRPYLVRRLIDEGMDAGVAEVVVQPNLDQVLEYALQEYRERRQPIVLNWRGYTGALPTHDLSERWFETLPSHALTTTYTDDLERTQPPSAVPEAAK